MKVVIRADASSNIGSGHIMRCLTLAASLRKLGFYVLFVCAELPGNLVSFIRTKGFDVVVLPVESEIIRLRTPPEHLWCAEHQSIDAELLVQRFIECPPDILIVDHYGLDVKWHKTARRLNSKIVVIDDLINRSMDCDILLNQNIVDLELNPYQELVENSQCKYLTGPSYALLRPEVYDLANQSTRVQSNKKQICVFLGYIDPESATLKVLSGLLMLKQKVSIHLILNPLHPDYDVLLRRAAEYPNVTVYTKFVELVGLFKKCDIVIGAGGGASWERCCLGVPSVQIALTDNQISVCEALERRNAVRYLGKGNEISSRKVYEVTLEILSNQGVSRAISNSARHLVDGLGVNRVIAEICENYSKNSQSVFNRPLIKGDADMVYDWQHEPDMRKHCRIDAPPDKSEHNRWIDNRVEDNSSLTEIIVHDNQPVGMIRLDWAADMQAMEVSILLTTSARNKGIAKIALELVIAQYKDTPIVAYINSENTTSQHLFSNIGFVMSNQDNWWLLNRD